MSDPNAPWELTFIPGGALDPTYPVYFRNLWFGNDTFVATGVEPYAIEDDVILSRVFIASAATPDGPWRTTAWVNESSDSVEQIIWALTWGDGLWVAVLSADTAQTFIIYTAEDPAGTWTQRATLNVSYRNVTTDVSLAYDGTRWGLQLNGVIFTTSDPTGSWTEGHDFWETEQYAYGFTTRYPEAFRLFLLDGEWVMAVGIYYGIYFPGAGVDDAIKIFSASNPAGTWTEEAVIGGPMYFGTTDGDLFSSHEGIVFCVGGRIYLASSLSGPWSTKVNWSTEYLEGNYQIRLGYGDGYYVVADGEYFYNPSTGSEELNPVLHVSTSLDDPFQKTSDESNLGFYAQLSAPRFGNASWGFASNDNRGSIWTPDESSLGTGWGLTL